MIKKVLRKVKNLLRRVRNLFRRWFCFGCYLKERKIKRINKTVVFICQYIPAWNKNEPIYEHLIKNKEFDVKILCVPENVLNGKLTDDDVSNPIYDYFINKGYDNVINALVEKDKWFDLKSLEPSFVFYPRPYDHFMPTEYTSAVVARYAKVCCILYGMTFSKQDHRVVLNDCFFRNTYYYFAESQESANYIKRRYPLAHLFGLRKSLYLGYPALEQVAKSKDLKNQAWDFSKNEFRVMWTPRWTTDKALGGSNFFTYKDFMVEFAEKNKDVDFLYRPHPLMFDNFIKTGEMTKEEVDSYHDVCDKLANVSIDKEKEYVASFWNSSVLITDISAILPEYFVTGKPIIYCATNMILTTHKYINKIFEGCYIANSKEDIEKYIAEIKNGNDYLKEKREQINKSLWGDYLFNCSEKIYKELCD